jgi:hypothetical protein
VGSNFGSILKPVRFDLAPVRLNPSIHPSIHPSAHKINLAPLKTAEAMYLSSSFIDLQLQSTMMEFSTAAACNGKGPWSAMVSRMVTMVLCPVVVDRRRRRRAMPLQLGTMASCRSMPVLYLVDCCVVAFDRVHAA